MRMDTMMGFGTIVLPPGSGLLSCTIGTIIELCKNGIMCNTVEIKCGCWFQTNLSPDVLGREDVALRVLSL